MKLKPHIANLISLFALLLFIFASEGPKSGGTFADDTSIGSTGWVDHNNASTSNDVWATASIDNGVTSYYFKATNFGFSSVSGTVDGIVVVVEALCDDDNFIADSSVRLVKGGVITGDNKAFYEYISTENNATYPIDLSTSDLWGETWTPSDITSSTFGVVFACTNIGAFPTTMYIDHIRITVYYTAAAGGTKRRVFGETRDTDGNGKVELLHEYEYRVNWKFGRV